MDRLASIESVVMAQFELTGVMLSINWHLFCKLPSTAIQ